MAVIHLGLGDQISLFEYLDEAYRQKVWRIIELTMPFDSLRLNRAGWIWCNESVWRIRGGTG